MPCDPRDAGAVIAAQAVISGAYSMTRQAIQLGYLPRMRILLTSAHAVRSTSRGQLVLLAAVLLALAFGHSSRSPRIRHRRHGDDRDHHAAVLRRRRAPASGPPLALVIGGARGLRQIVDLALPRSQPRPRSPSGGWLPLVARRIRRPSLCSSRGTRDRSSSPRNRERPARAGCREFVTGDAPPPGCPTQRVPGTAVFLSRGNKTTPLRLRAVVEHTRTPARARDRALNRDPAPHRPSSPTGAAPPSTTSSTNDDGITHVSARYGFLEEAERHRDPPARRAPRASNPRSRSKSASFFLSTIDIVPTDAPGMSPAGASGSSARSPASRPIRSSTSCCRASKPF